jgi:hypothetical protein
LYQNKEAPDNPGRAAVARAIAAFIEQAICAERQACAAIADSFLGKAGDGMAREIASLIRSRSNGTEVQATPGELKWEDKVDLSVVTPSSGRSR